MSEDTNNVLEFPLKSPDLLCNHRLARQSGYCRNKAGAGTDHLGYGRCKVHQEGADGNREDLLHVLGLGQLIATAEIMTRDDQEYLYHVSNNALVIQRAQTIRQMDSSIISPKERKELVETVAKIDAILSKQTIEIKGEGENEASAEDAAELARIEAIGS